jgi:hypothetical protein
MEVKCDLILNKKVHSDTKLNIWYCGTCKLIRVVEFGGDPKVAFNCKETK